MAWKFHTTICRAPEKLKNDRAALENYIKKELGRKLPAPCYLTTLGSTLRGRGGIRLVWVVANHRNAKFAAREHLNDYDLRLLRREAQESGYCRIEDDPNDSNYGKWEYPADPAKHYPDWKGWQDFLGNYSVCDDCGNDPCECEEAT